MFRIYMFSEYSKCKLIYQPTIYKTIGISGILHHVYKGDF